MIAPRFVILTGLALLLATAFCAPASAQQAPRHPMIFFLAKGGPDACGPGCSEWIAAEGEFGSDTLGRFNSFLHAINRTDLTVFFHSPGGFGNVAIAVGHKLRGWRIAAGVGRTLVKGCNEGPPDEACLVLMQSEQQLDAELRFDGTICASACVFAFAGAPVRQVSELAKLGIHASRFGDRQWGIDTTAVEQAARERSRDSTQHYFVSMGIDGSLVEEAEKTPHHGVHWLSRDEIARFGLIAKDGFETGWTLAGNPLVVMKALSRATPRTTIFKVKCHTDERAQIVVRRELPDEELGLMSEVALVSGRSTVSQSTGANDSRDDERIFIVPRAVLREIAANGLKLEERAIAEESRIVRSTPVAMAGFADAIDRLLQRCGAARSQPAVPAPRRLRFSKVIEGILPENNAGQGFAAPFPSPD